METEQEIHNKAVDQTLYEAITSILQPYDLDTIDRVVQSVKRWQVNEQYERKNCR